MNTYPYPSPRALVQPPARSLAASSLATGLDSRHAPGQSKR